MKSCKNNTMARTNAGLADELVWYPFYLINGKMSESLWGEISEVKTIFNASHF
jgi:hypothetical protein